MSSRRPAVVQSPLIGIRAVMPRWTSSFTGWSIRIRSLRFRLTPVRLLATLPISLPPTPTTVLLTSPTTILRIRSWPNISHPMPLKELSLNNILLNLHLMQRHRTPRILPDQNCRSQRPLLLHQQPLQHRQQPHKFLEVLLILIFPFLYALCGIFLLDVQYLACAGLVAPRIEVAGAPEPKLILAGYERLADFGRFLGLRFQLEDLRAGD